MNKDKLHIEETKEWLNGASQTSIAVKYGSSVSAVRPRLHKTIRGIVDHFGRYDSGIEFPLDSIGRIDVWEAQDKKEFWLSLIADYEAGYDARAYKVPEKVIDQDYRRISDLTVSEFKALMHSILKEQQ